MCNVLFIIVGAHFLYKLSRYFADDYCANSICFLWGIMPFSVYTSSVGLKENYMVFCVIISVYYLYEFMRRSTFRNLLLFGGFAVAAIKMMKEDGVKKVKFLCLIAAPEGIKRVEETYPDVQIYCASIDDHLNEDCYIVPGLGDAGDRIFGIK